VITAKKKAAKVWANGMAFGEVGAGNGIAWATRAPKPTCWRKATKLQRPPKGVTALGVSAISTLAPPKSGVNAVVSVLWSVCSEFGFTQLTYLKSLFRFHPSFNFGVRV